MWLAVSWPWRFQWTALDPLMLPWMPYKEEASDTSSGTKRISTISFVGKVSELRICPLCSEQLHEICREFSYSRRRETS
jgi:hypothetical protein